MKKRAIAHVAVVAALLACGATAGVPTQSTVASPGQASAARTFASQIEALSEPGGYFDTDNLISNERSYLDVVPALRRLEVGGGAYVGVGPDQNFTYIAEIRPDIALHRRRPARQPAAPPALQGAVHPVGHARRVPGGAGRTASARGCPGVAHRAHRTHRRPDGDGRRSTPAASTRCANASIRRSAGWA